LVKSNSNQTPLDSAHWSEADGCSGETRLSVAGLETILHGIVGQFSRDGVFTCKAVTTLVEPTRFSNIISSSRERHNSDQFNQRDLHAIRCLNLIVALHATYTGLTSQIITRSASTPLPSLSIHLELFHPILA
jgi:hypothetical protein